jgi:hypothetical protein
MKKIYISIPVTGLDESTQRRKALIVKAILRSRDHQVINPFDLVDALRDFLEREPAYDECMEVCLAAIEEELPDIFLVEGWSFSNGCMDEVDLGVKLNLKFSWTL